MKFSEVYMEMSDEEYLNFEAIPIENRRSSRPDVHAFILLDKWIDGDDDIIAAAEHDEIWLSIEPDDLDGLSENQMIELIRCGVRYDFETDSLAMFA